MPDSFYPSINILLKLESIPDTFEFVKTALNDATNKLYYKNLQRKDSGKMAYIYI